MRSLADVRASKADARNEQKQERRELTPSVEYLLGVAPSEPELRSINIGSEVLSVAVVRRPNGKAIPRAMIAGITASDLVDLVGPANFYYGNQVDFTRRVDCPSEVATAVSKGVVEIGIVAEVPQPLQENVGVLLTANMSSEAPTVAVLGKVSSPIGIGG